MYKLVFITAYYKADSEGGIAISLSEDAGNLEGMVELISDTWQDRYEAAIADGTQAILIQDMFAELDTLVQQHRPIDVRDSLLAFGNIQMLVGAGALKQDEENGVAMIYEVIVEPI